MDENTQGTAGRAAPKRGKGFLWAFLAVLIAFGAGYGWQWYEGRSIREQLDRTEKELRIERLRIGLAQAAVAAQSGDFEAARRQMSEFFTHLQDAAEDLPPDLAALAQTILVQRDDVITGLSRSNAQYVGVLYGMLNRFEAAAPQAGAETPEPDRSAPSTAPSGVGNEPAGGEQAPGTGAESAGSALPAAPPAVDSGAR